LSEFFRSKLEIDEADESFRLKKEPVFDFDFGTRSDWSLDESLFVELITDDSPVISVVTFVLF
jgi:hypothetical protein